MNFDKFFEGYELEAYKLLGAHKKDDGVEFSLWAPNAYKVKVFTSKDWNKFYDLKKIDNRGIWYVFIPDMELKYSYRYRIYKDNKTFKDMSDPYSYGYELRPNNASCMYDIETYKFTDNLYMSINRGSLDKAVNIYEVYLNSFSKDSEFTSYKKLKEDLIPYVKNMGYTHIELMPVFEHPFDGSWGYQSTGFFAVTSRYGSPQELMDFINECHLNDIGVLLDVVYVHFAIDDFALKQYDYGYCYETGPNRTQWDTYYFDLGKGPVISFLMSSANFFLKQYHIDGLRFDAVSHIIYHDGNSNNGLNENGLSFIKRLNYHIKKENPNCILIAEDSTSYPNVTKRVEDGGLGFDYKWDLGWMNDTLKYYAIDPVYKKYNHNLITFSMAYFFSERFILPLSHDEVVHIKGTILNKMWGDYETKFRLCRNLFAYMFAHPGKKLNFIGNDIGQFREFDENKIIDWSLLSYPIHDSFKRMFRDLCQIYIGYAAFYRFDYNYEYFKWIDADNNDQSIYSFYRKDDDFAFVFVFNMTPSSYENYDLGVPYSGDYIEIFNSEKDIYNGCNMCNFTPIKSSNRKAHNFDQSINIRIAPYAAIYFRVDIKKADTYHLDKGIVQMIA